MIQQRRPENNQTYKLEKPTVDLQLIQPHFHYKPSR